MGRSPIGVERRNNGERRPQNHDLEHGSSAFSDSNTTSAPDQASCNHQYEVRNDEDMVYAPDVQHTAQSAGPVYSARGTVRATGIPKNERPLSWHEDLGRVSNISQATSCASYGSRSSFTGFCASEEYTLIEGRSSCISRAEVDDSIGQIFEPYLESDGYSSRQRRRSPLAHSSIDKYDAHEYGSAHAVDTDREVVSSMALACADCCLLAAAAPFLVYQLYVGRRYSFQASRQCTKEAFVVEVAALLIFAYAVWFTLCSCCTRDGCCAKEPPPTMHRGDWQPPNQSCMCAYLCRAPTATMAAIKTALLCALSIWMVYLIATFANPAARSCPQELYFLGFVTGAIWACFAMLCGAYFFACGCHAIYVRCARWCGSRPLADASGLAAAAACTKKTLGPHGVA